MGNVETLETLENKTGPPDRPGGAVELGPLVVRLLCADDLAGAPVRYRLDRCTSAQLFRSRSGRFEVEGKLLRIPFEDPYGSGRHALLSRSGEGWLIADEGSKNGTFVDGQRLAAGEQRSLGQAALLELGHTFFFFRANAHGPVDLPPVLDAGRPDVPEPLTLNPEWEQELANAGRLARTDHEILVQGESGAGKEVLARFLHERSGRRGPLIAVNCGALAENLLDDELFGHVRGAFSGAHADRQGLIRAADQGTLFLDEVGDMPPALQAKLLRVLEDHRVRPIGSEKDFEADVRVIAATHRDLKKLVAEGKFREDLFARLGLVPIHVPSLRERREDLGLIIRAILRPLPRGLERIRFELEALRLVLLHPWPLNVRELRRAVLAAVDLAEVDASGQVVIGPRHLPETVREPAPAASSGMGPRGAPGAPKQPLEEPQRDLTPAEQELRTQIIGLLAHHGGNVAAVARELARPRTQVQRLMARFQIDRTGRQKAGVPGSTSDGDA